ncbi:MAG: hypothetical protein NW216_04960 [Hyphomicrobium sp.]|nr:hypothetical protein [Hyphomicrobium sp.]
MRLRIVVAVSAAFCATATAEAGEPSQLGATGVTPAVDATERPKSARIPGPERVVLPYSCVVENGMVRLSPSPERTFPVIEGREMREFETCDPPFSRNCTKLTIHRFDMACGGQRVPWPRVVEAMGRTKAGVARIERGLLTLVRSAAPAQGHAPSCRDTSATSDSAECLPWKVRRNVESIVVPKGFAPASEVGARFLNGSAPAEMSSSMLALATTAGGGKIVAEEAPSAGVPEFSLTIETEPEIATASTRVAAAPEIASQWLTVVDTRVRHEGQRAASGGPSIGFGLWLMAFAMLAGGAAVVAAMRGRLDMSRINAMTSRLHAYAAPELVRLRARIPSVSGVVQPLRAMIAPEPMIEPAERAVFAEMRRACDMCRASVENLAGAEPVKAVLLDEVSKAEAKVAKLYSAAGTQRASVVRTTAQLRTVGRDLDRVTETVLAVARWTKASAPAGDAIESPESSLMPKSRDEALAYFGCTTELGDEVLEKFVETVRRACHPDFATSADDRLERMRRIERIDAAWQILKPKS